MSLQYSRRLTMSLLMVIVTVLFSACGAPAATTPAEAPTTAAVAHHCSGRGRSDDCSRSGSNTLPTAPEATMAATTAPEEAATTAPAGGEATDGEILIYGMARHLRQDRSQRDDLQPRRPNRPAHRRSASVAADARYL